MFTFIHAADIHLDSPMHKLESYEGAPVDDFRLSTRRAFDNLVERAISEQTAFLLISGDLYDGDWKDYNTGLFFISRMNRLREAGIRVFITAGNHDAASTITRSLRLPDNVTLFPAGRAETVTLDDPPVAVHGRSFATPAEKSDFSLDYPAPRPGRFNIGMLHTCAGGRSGHEPYAPCSLENLQAKGYDYWALGHVHQHEILSENPPVVFPGNTQGRHIRESGPRGAVQVTVDKDMAASLAFIETDVARWQELETDAGSARSGWDVVAAFAARLEEAVAENSGLPLAVRAVITGETPAAAELFSEPERWTGELRAAAMEAGGSRVWVEKVVFDCCLPGSRLPDDEEDDEYADRHAEPHEKTPAGGAVSELLSLFQELEVDPEARSALADVLADFDRKLPRELKEGPDALRLNDAEGIGELLGQVRPELLGRLMKKGRDQ